MQTYHIYLKYRPPPGLLGHKQLNKKVENSTLLKKGTILVPQKALFFLNIHVHEALPLGHWLPEIVPLRVPYYGQSNTCSDIRVTVLLLVHVPFLSECILTDAYL